MSKDGNLSSSPIRTTSPMETLYPAETPPFSIPVISAIPVPTPVQAIHVVIDKDQQDHAATGEDEVRSDSAGPESSSSSSRNGKPNHKRVFMPEGATVAGTAIMAIGLTLFVILTSLQTNTHHDCFSSTKDLVQATRDEPDRWLFIICPNTSISIGRFRDTVHEDFGIEDGDWPLYLLRSNMDIRCGVDGKVEDNCALDGGAVQIVAHDPLPPSTGVGVTNLLNHTNNITIRGLTLTGRIAADKIVGGGSVILSSYAQEIRFIDCLWQDLSTLQDVVWVGQTGLQIFFDAPAPDNYVSVSLTNCTFRRVLYGNTVIFVHRQQFQLEGTIFEDIRFPTIVDKCIIGYMFCQAIVVCDGCRGNIHDACLNNVEHNGPASLLAATESANATLSGTIAMEGIQQRHSHSQNVTYCHDGYVQCMEGSNVCECVPRTWDSASKCWLAG